MATAAPIDEVRAPSALLALTELPRALAELGSLSLAAPLLAGAPKGDGHPVLVLPGFVASDASTAVLRRYLKQLGYDAHAWELGRNFGPRAIGREGEKLVERLRVVHERTGEKVSLVGWSLGGVMARLLARRAPDAVRQVITLGSPFAGSPKASNVWRAYQLLTGQKIDDAHTKRQLAEVAAPPPVPATAIYSREDGIVAWQNCLEPAGPESENIQVRGSHCGLGVNPAVLYAIADRLAQPLDGWRPFAAKGLMGLMYPRGNA
ncbi:esterase/lipase family protein [uncultured Sphingomonas sp.]|uniref:esterase/lipase family protein n=1 Tax=uncultured Sphingomonas sp. TaxID=158754 RepID=UPI0035CA5E3D